MGSFCTGCGNGMASGDRFCRVCGRDATAAPGATPPVPMPPGMPMSSPPASPTPGTVPETSGKAVGSLVCGLFFWIPPVSIVAVILGHISLSEIRKSAGRLTGNGLAIAGLVLGYMGLAVIPVLIIAAIAIPNLLRARMAANEASAVANVKTLIEVEITYSTLHPKSGFTCEFSELQKEHLIASDLASGRKSGYIFELQDCAAEDNGANTKFQVVAYPLGVNTTGIRAFCSDQSGDIKVDAAGSAQGCIENGPLLQ